MILGSQEEVLGVPRDLCLQTREGEKVPVPSGTVPERKLLQGCIVSFRHCAGTKVAAQCLGDGRDVGREVAAKCLAHRGGMYRLFPARCRKERCRKVLGAWGGQTRGVYRHGAGTEVAARYFGMVSRVA